MTEGTIRKFRVHYRQAKFVSENAGSKTLQQSLAAAMSTQLKDDAEQRIFPIARDGTHKGCIHFWHHDALFFASEILHFDGRKELPMWVRPGKPVAFAEIMVKQVDAGEESLSEPAYFMVCGNHVALIERMGFRTPQLSRYLNALLENAEQLKNGDRWDFGAKVEVEGGSLGSSKVSKIVFTPHAAIGGEAPSLAATAGQARRTRQPAKETYTAFGTRIIQALREFGADETKIEQLQEQMSSDLILKAKITLSIQKATRQVTEASVTQDQIVQALAELSDDGDLEIRTEDGKLEGKLTRLSHDVDVLETRGVIPWANALEALRAALSTWSAKGAIELGIQ